MKDIGRGVLEYDPVLAQEFPRFVYYDLYGVVDYCVNPYLKNKRIPESLKRAYTSDEMIENLSKSNQYGPWEDTLLAYKSVAGKREIEEGNEE